MYLIWRMNTTAKGAKKNTSPNVIHLQYYPAGYLDLLFDSIKTKASVIMTFCFFKEKENFCFAGLSDAAIHHLL